MITITKEKLEKMFEYYAMLEEHKNISTDLLKEAKEKGKNKRMLVERKNIKKKQLIKEPDLWEEVRHLGAGCNAQKALLAKYPEVFESFTKQEKLANEMKEWTVQNLGIDYRAIKLSDLVRLIQSLISYDKTKK